MDHLLRARRREQAGQRLDVADVDGLNGNRPYAERRESRTAPDAEIVYDNDDVDFGRDVVVRSFTNIYGCRISDNTHVGPFVEIQRGVIVGANCKIESHAFICEGVEIEDEVFVGHGTLFTNDKFPRATDESGVMKTEQDWKLLRTVVERGASLGSGSI